MMGVVIPFESATIYVYPCPQGWRLTHIGPTGDRRLGTFPYLQAARAAANAEAFRIGRCRCRVQIVSRVGRS